MKTFKKITVVCSVAVMLLPSLSFAGGISGNQTIKQIKVHNSGRIQVWGNAGDWNNPVSCDSAAYALFLPEQDGVINEYYSEMYALAVASYLQGKTVNGWISKCALVGSTTYPVLNDITSQ